MKVGFIALVVLSLAAFSPANGQGPGTGGVLCVNDCVFPDTSDTGVGRSAFQRLVKRASASEDIRCQATEKALTCVEGCQVERYESLARETRRSQEAFCGDNVDEATREQLFAQGLQFQQAWIYEQEKCSRSATTPEQTCRDATDCVFGTALTSAKKGFSLDVVSVNVNWYKMAFVVSAESGGENLPSSCDLIFEPGVPEPPYPPEPYPYEPYQPNPYQHNPYQRNPYQRNPYQRNPYQRNPYQRNSYQRNPYGRRN